MLDFNFQFLIFHNLVEVDVFYWVIFNTCARLNDLLNVYSMVYHRWNLFLQLPVLLPNKVKFGALLFQLHISQLVAFYIAIVGSVAAHLRGMRPAPTSKKDTLMLREKLKQKHY